MISHFLIGPPSSGKSTFAAFLNQLYPTAVIISTDAIRAQLFGDATVQGDWSLIEEEVLCQMRHASSLGQSVIYDATNAKPEWRKSMLSLVSHEGVQWWGWHLQTPLELCLLWNKTRQRQVPEAVIVEFYRFLRDFPPQVSDGFAVVNAVKVTSKQFKIQNY